MLAAVSASISTPVWPESLHRVRIWTEAPSSPGVSSTFTEVRFSAWQRGIRSWVLLAAIMPAIRAVASTSPFGCSPSTIIRRVSGCIRMVASARASRSVTALSVTSTIRASPLSSRCVSLLTIVSASVIQWVISARPGYHQKPIPAIPWPPRALAFAMWPGCIPPSA